MRVLAADDNEALAQVLGRQLRGWGYEATIVGSGIEAWRILKHEDAPRIVILDWDMPGLSGLEICRLFRSTPHGATAYVLLLTGRGDKEDLIQALESGADDFLSKPFDSRELQLRLAKGIRDAAREGAPATPTLSAPPPSGSILGGKYRLEKKIGEGGMGSVWLGVHLSLGINVAIKFMARNLTDIPDYVSFEREARAAAQLRNEHIVRIYDHGIAHDGLPYLVMEYLAGDSLFEWVERHGPLSPGALASLVEQTARALTAAHDRTVVHRDVKPDNILMVEDPDQAHGFLVKLIDFGLAKPARLVVLPEGLDEASASKAGKASFVAGTPIYMSPECLSSRHPATPLLDLWGLAVTTYFAATGVLPFESESLSDLRHRICVAPLPVPSGVCPSVPQGFDAWFAHACARDPASRFQSATELASTLTSVCKGAPDTPRRSPGVAKTPTTFAPTEPDSDPAIASSTRRTALVPR
jgi:eukaryotic-like serine/threonine-protein kinase